MQGDISLYALSNTLKAEWDKLAWLHVTATVGMNQHWKDHDVFSASHNMLSDYNYTLRTDWFPANSLHIYADFSQIIHEISHKDFTTVSFLNAGMKYTLSKHIRLNASILNILNKKLYKESAYDGANYTYYEIPLWGREFVVAVNFKF